MANTTPQALVTTDKANADGRVTTFALEVDYQFAAPKENGAFGGFYSVWPQHTLTEQLTAFGCVRPRGAAFARSMVLSPEEWTIARRKVWNDSRQVWEDGPPGKVRLTRPAIVSAKELVSHEEPGIAAKYQRPAFLDFYDSSPNGAESATHNQWHWPNMAALIVRHAPAENAGAYASYIKFEFLGNPLNSAHRKFTFIFPVGDPTYKYPVLSESGGDIINYQQVAEWDSGQPNSKGGNAFELDEIWFEWVDGAWHIRRMGVEGAWVYRPMIWQKGLYVPNPNAFSPGPVRVSVYGHAALVWFGDITYPVLSTVTNKRYEYADPTIFNATRVWHGHSWNPDADNWVVDYGENANPNPTAPNEFVPYIIFGKVGASNRPPAVYVASGLSQATQADVSSSPLALTMANSYRVESISYELNVLGRGQTCMVGYADKTGTPAVKSNQKCTVAVGWNTDTTPTTAQKFLGYVRDLQQAKPDDRVAEVQVQAQLGDPIEARLTKKFMVNKSAAGGEYLSNWLYRLLYNAGAPAIQLTAILAMADTGPIIPMGTPKGDLRWQHSCTTCVVDAADEVVDACGYEWGWNAETGLFFLRVPDNREAASITPDYVLNEADTAAPDFKWNFTHQSGPEDFRNVLYAVSETLGEQWSTLYIDNASRATSSDGSYIGDDWWDVLSQDDTPVGIGKTVKRWRELLKGHSLVSWNMRGRTDLGPGKFVKMKVSKVGVVTDALYEIVSENGELRWGTETTPSFVQTLTAREWKVEAV